MNIAKILIKILLLTTLVSGGIYVAKQNSSINDLQLVKKIEEKKDQFQGSVKGITDNVSDQTKQLTTRGQEVGTHVNNILGAYIKPAEETQENQSKEEQSEKEQTTDNQSSENSSQNKPIYEETLDYGRYLYCQQVIKDYKNQHN